MHHILIVEDDPIQRIHIRDLVRKHWGENALISCFSSAEEYLAAPSSAEIALLDIELPGQSGVELGTWLNETSPCCQIIYLTAHITYAMDVYRTNHFWFMVKEKAALVLPELLDQAAARFSQLQNSSLPIFIKSGIQLLSQHEILYIERIQRKSHIVLANQTFEVSEPLQILYSRLDSQYFIRCHNSFIVNLRCVRCIHRTELILANQTVIPISRHYQASVFEIFSKYIGDTPVFPFQSS